MKIVLQMLVGLGLVTGPCMASALMLLSSLPSPQPAGTSIVFTISGMGETDERYRLSVAPASHPERTHLLYDESAYDVLEWTPLDPGVYRITAAVRNTATGQQSEASQIFTIDPAVSPQTPLPALLPTSNPLVALYVSPPCTPPARMQVRFTAPAIGLVQTTPPKPCTPDTPLHVYVAGMRESTLYQMQHQILAPDDALLDEGPVMEFTSAQADITISPTDQTIPRASETASPESLIWYAPIGAYPYATDLDGHLMWYLKEEVQALRPSKGGALWVLKSDPLTSLQNSLLAKVDLLGHVIEQISVESLNDTLGQLGYADRINDIHHDVRELPNGDLAFLATVERLLTDVQGSGSVSVLGDMILVTDRNFQIKWLWNGWDHLDPTRLATLGEICTLDESGCPPLFLADQANDWMHANALAYTPDGNLMLSVRHQDWILKIHYANGRGDGRILWRLGPEGDFTLVGGSQDDWFSHQHDPSFIANDRIILFDNGNGRCESETSSSDCQSRGQVWRIDEREMTAEPILNKSLGEYAYAVGSGQRLMNGHYWFTSGLLGTFADPRASMQEVDPNATSIFQNDLDTFQYRSYRLTDLYRTPLSWEGSWPSR